MRILAGPDAQVHFTYLSKPSSQSLDSAFTMKSQNPSALAAFSCHQEGVLDLMKTSEMPIDKVCLLDPKAEQELSPEDGDNFQWFLFGVSSSNLCHLVSAFPKKRLLRHPQGILGKSLLLVGFNCIAGSILFFAKAMILLGIELLPFEFTVSPLDTWVPYK